MKARVIGCILAVAGLVGCTTKSSGNTVVNDDPVLMRSSPAGTATLGFLDLEASVRPDALPTVIALAPQGAALGLSAKGTGQSCLVSSIVGNVVTYTFSNCTAASTGALNGTLVATLTLPSAGTTVCTEVFDLVSALDATRSWRYTGTQTVTIAGTAATVTGVPLTAIHAVFTDSTTPANNKTYVFTPALTVNWATAGQVVLDGSYTFAREGAETITVTLPPSDPLVWNAACSFPVSGTLAIALTGPATGSASTTAIFGPTCGQMTLGGGTISIGQ